MAEIIRKANERKGDRERGKTARRDLYL